MSNEHREWDDTAIFSKAVEQGWPLKPERLALAVEKIMAALENAESNRDVARLVSVLRSWL
jgi:hypothetical protein